MDLTEVIYHCRLLLNWLGVQCVHADQYKVHFQILLQASLAVSLGLFTLAARGHDWCGREYDGSVVFQRIRGSFGDWSSQC